MRPAPRCPSRLRVSAAWTDRWGRDFHLLGWAHVEGGRLVGISGASAEYHGVRGTLGEWGLSPGDARAAVAALESEATLLVPPIR